MSFPIFKIHGFDFVFQTKTSVVRRKTTHIKSPRIDLQTPSDTDSDSNTMARRREGSGKVSGEKVNKKLKNRFCEECEIETEKGVDMFRIHRTGRTICKDCWIRMDPDNDIPKNKRKRNASDSKTCKVFLEDVLTNTNSQEPKPYTINKSEDGRLLFTILDDSLSGNESRSGTKTKAQLKELPEIKELSKTKKLSKRKVVSKATEPTRVLSKRARKVSEPIEIIDGEKFESTKKEKTEKSKFQKPTKLQKPKSERSVVVDKPAPTKRVKRANGNQNSDSDVPKTKKSRSSSVESSSSTKVKKSGRPLEKSRSRGDSESTAHSEDSSQAEDGPKRKLRERSHSIVSVSSNASHSSTKKGLKGKKLSPISSKESSPVLKFKSPPRISKPSVAKRGKGRPRKTEVVERTSFSCAVCGNNFVDNKEYRLHQELHLKNLEIKLPQMVVEKERHSERLPITEEEVKRIDDLAKSENVETTKESEDKSQSQKAEEGEKLKEENKEDMRGSVQEKISSVENKESEEDKTTQIKDKPVEKEPIPENKSLREKPQDEDSQSQDDDRENLEDLLQREELQVIDEVAESASSAVDPDEEQDKEVLGEKSESVEEDFEVVYTESSQDSFADNSKLNLEGKEVETCDKGLGIESLEKTSEESVEKEAPSEREPSEIAEKDPLQEETLEKESLDAESVKEATKTESTVQEPTESSIKELKESEQVSRHSTHTKDEIENKSEKTTETIEDTQVVENPVETIDDFTNNIPESEENLENTISSNDLFEHLPQEIDNVVQNGLEVENLSEVNQIVGEVQIESEIENPVANEIATKIIDEITNEIVTSRIENEGNKAEETVREILQEVFDVATMEVEKESVKFTPYVPSQDLEEISNDGVNGEEIPALETEESNL